MRYRADMDWWIGLAIAAGITIPILVTESVSSPCIFAVGAGFWIAAFLVYRSREYVLLDGELVIRQMFGSVKVGYAQMIQVRVTSGVSQLQASVVVETASGDVLVSPRDSEAFVDDLLSRAPHIVRRRDNCAAKIAESRR